MKLVPHGTVPLLALLGIVLAASSAFAQTTIFAGAVTPLGYCQLTSLASAVVITSCTGGVPAGAKFADVIVETQAIRYRTDGVSPTASVGMPLAVGTDKIFTLTNLKVLKFIEQASGAVINIEFFK